MKEKLVKRHNKSHLWTYSTNHILFCLSPVQVTGHKETAVMFFKGAFFPQDSIYMISCLILGSAVVESGALQRFHVFKVLLIIESQPESVLMWNMSLKWNLYCTQALSGPIRNVQTMARTVSTSICNLFTHIFHLLWKLPLSCRVRFPCVFWVAVLFVVCFSKGLKGQKGR